MQINSRAFIIVFEPLYYALQAYTRNFLGRLSCFLYFGAAFKKTIFHWRLLDIIIAISAIRASLALVKLIIVK